MDFIIAKMILDYSDLKTFYHLLLTNKFFHRTIVDNQCYFFNKYSQRIKSNHIEINISPKGYLNGFFTQPFVYRILYGVNNKYQYNLQLVGKFVNGWMDGIWTIYEEYDDKAEIDIKFIYQMGKLIDKWSPGIVTKTFDLYDWDDQMELAKYRDKLASYDPFLYIAIWKREPKEKLHFPNSWILAPFNEQ